MTGGRKVAVTGLGALSPVGNTAEDSWRAVVAGKSGIAAISRFDPSAFSARIAGEVRDFNVADYLPEKRARHMDLFIHYGVAAGMQAVSDAGLGDSEPDPERIGVAIGSGIGGLRMIEKVQDIYRESGARRISPFFVPATIINMISGHLSIMYNFFGPNVAMVSACTTGAHNIGDAYRMICYGDADVMVCGGAEAAITPLGLGSFASARALTPDYADEPERASRPFDSRRNGFVLGEGAGVLVLEEYERARARGAKIYAMMGGYGMSADGYHMTAPRENGEGAARAMQNAMRDAGLNGEDVDYINVHGTSTPLGDIAETRAIRAALGNAAGRVMASSTKSMVGHLLGAAGGLEAVFSVLALRDNIAPPTINIDFPDSECDLDYVAGAARQKPLRNVLSNSFGFGGTNATLAFGAA
ncbi:MAG: beta-ketoacyl-ACP synthase II [Gammaproteobacteria bacterium]